MRPRGRVGEKWGYSTGGLTIDGCVLEGDQITVDVDADGTFYVASDATGPVPTYEIPE